jgi:hypothetical protein
MGRASKLYNPEGQVVLKNLTRGRAVKEKCLACSSFSHKDVKACKFKDCHLYPFRIRTPKHQSVQRSKAIKEYCAWCMRGFRAEIRQCTADKCPLYNFRTGADAVVVQSKTVLLAQTDVAGRPISEVE